MRIGHVTSSISRIGAGVSKLVRDLAEAEAVSNDSIIIFTLLDQFTKVDQPDNKRITVIACPVTFSPRFGYSRPLQNMLCTHSSSIDVIHMHGLWMYPNKAAGNVAQKSTIPYIISPHGMLENWSLGRSSWKKKLTGLLFEYRNLAQASCLHACSEQEYDSIRAFGYKGPVAVIPLGLTCAEYDHASCVEPGARGLLPPLTAYSDKRILLFLSRLHIKKGLEFLLDAWKAAGSSFPEWHLVIAGDGEADYVATLKRKFQTAGLDDSVTFIGAVHGDDKWALLKRVELFVLPTLSENFGLVVAEALASGVPVITTKGAPWSDLELGKCGWWIETGSLPLSACFESALSLPSKEMAEMGKRGRQLVEHKYLINKTAHMLQRVYAWILNYEVKPDFVRLN